MIGVTILGATGSIGASTLDVLARNADRYRVVALTANRNIERLYEQCLRFRPTYAAVNDPRAAAILRELLERDHLSTEVLEGPAALEEVARLPETHYVMAAIVGAAGLLPTLAAVRAGKRVLLANKESLVMSGELFMAEAERRGADILPVDSEHNAVFQCLPSTARPGFGNLGVRRILLTASGGPFRTLPVDQLSRVTPEQACAHPNWEMGRRISIDSATMMNKGFEVIEACWLFQARPAQIEVVIHPQSIVHSMVEYLDGSVLAQLGNPDMRTPIAHALAWPQRVESGADRLSICDVGRLDFEAVEHDRFPCLGLAYQAIRAGGTCPAILNAADEEAVAGFLAGRLPFDRIPAVIESCLALVPSRSADCVDTILEDDALARAEARRLIAGPRRTAAP